MSNLKKHPIMNTIENKKFQKLKPSEMAELYGGGIIPKWSKWKTLEVDDGDCNYTYEQRYNWFGLNSTTDIRADE